MKITCEYIENCIRRGTYDIMEEPGILRGFNMGNGKSLYLRRVTFSPKDFSDFTITSIIEVTLRNGFSDSNGSLKNAPLVSGTKEIYLHNEENIGNAVEYFSYHLGLK